MAASLLGGAAVGAVFGELLKAVLEMKDKAIMFKPTLGYLQTTLIAIDPVIKEIEQHNNELGRQEKELELLIREMEEGTKLVYKCSKIHKLNFPARIRYQEQLVALVESMVRFFMIDMQAQTARDLKETLLKVRRIHSVVNKLPLVSTEDRTGSASESESATAPVELSQIDIHDESMAMQPNDENEMETDFIEEAIEPETLQSTATQPAEDAAGTDSAELVMEDVTSLSQNVSQTEEKTKNSQEAKHLMSVKSFNQSYTDEKRFIGICLPKITPILHKIGGFNPFEPSSVYCIPCGTCIKQNVKLYTKGLEKISYSYCNQCHNERIRGKIIPYEGCPYNFDLEDLLSASAEVLGKTSYGTTYKVILKNGTTLVMKSLKNVVVEKKEFEEQMEIVQRVSQHPNVMPLLACYYSKDEKLLIYDYMAAGSFSKLLHGTRKDRQSQLDWDSRMKISLGVAKGIAHIHSLQGGTHVHGNISSSNVLVTNDCQGCISDLSITSSVSNSFNRFGKTGYQAPKVIETRKAKLTQKSDVYSFGILLLEMLAGNLPSEYDDLSSWVQLHVMDGLLHAVFDGAIHHDNRHAKQMLYLAQKCAAIAPSYRPSMDEVVRKMEEIRAS